MRILVTGSSGFVGRALVETLERRGYAVQGVTRQTAGGGSLTLDLMDGPAVAAVFAEVRPEIVFHLAARTALKGDATGFEDNVDMTRNVLAAVRGSPDVHRVVWLSSQLVNRPGRVPERDTDYDPPDAYGASKAESERLIRQNDGGGKTWVIARSTTIWGPGMSEHYAGVIRMIARGLYFHIGRRPLRKSYSYIDNLAAQLTTLAEAPPERIHGRTLYLADSPPIDLRAWADAFGAEFGRVLPTLPTPVAHLLGRVGDLVTRLGKRSPVTSDRVRNVLTEYVYPTDLIDALHGPPAVGWREGVRRTAAWIRSG